MLTLPQAVELAFRQSPMIRAQYAELGMSSAEALDAGKLPDLGLEYSRLAANGHAEITRGLSLALADVLLMHGRTKLSAESQRVVRFQVAARLSELEAEVQRAWFEHTAALQSAELQVRMTRVARASAEQARRLHAAGNLPPRALAQELAAAALAEVAAARAQAHVLETRAAFATLAGLSVRDDWRLSPYLPSLTPQGDPPPDIVERAQRSRLDLEAARGEVRVLDRAWRTTRFWRWLGDFEVGYEWQREDGAKLDGPTFRLGLPLLNWNRGGVLRARATLESAQARLTGLELEAANDLSLSLDRVATTTRIAQVYRDALVPQREAVTARTMEELNFMLVGAFEALAARREQFAAYQEYLEAVRDAWLARVDLRLASGGVLPLPVTTDTLNPDAPAPAAHHHGDRP